jgi:hypothetical protein
MFVFYPNPLMLIGTLWHTVSPPIDGAVARQIAADLPEDPNEIRNIVLNKLVPYDYDWTIYGVPWYFPGPAEVLRDKRGDCESQAVLLASILEAKGIPYQLKMSFDHMWIDFDEKRVSKIEHDEMAFVALDGGSIEVRLPKHFSLRDWVDIQLDARWHPMPIYRKALLGIGMLLIYLGPCLVRFFRAATNQRLSPSTADA